MSMIDTKMNYEPLIELLKSTANIDTFIESYSQHLNSIRPLFIISYGPPASGKSPTGNPFQITMECIGHHMNKPTNNQKDDDYCLENNILPVNVDNIIKMFKERVKDFVVDCKTLESDYVQMRSFADSFSDTLLNYGLNMRYNILWETTGSNYEWIMKEIFRIRNMGYRVVIYYPLVSLKNLIQRAESRQNATGQIGAPQERITQVQKLAAKNMERIILNKIKTGSGPDDVFIYDNNGSRNDTKSIFQLSTKKVTEKFNSKFLKPRVMCNYGTDGKKEKHNFSGNMDNNDILHKLNKFLYGICAWGINDSWEKINKVDETPDEDYGLSMK